MATTKSLDELLDAATARVAALKKKQADQERREATKIGRRMQRSATDRDTFTAEFRKIRDELFPVDPAPVPAPDHTTETPSGGEHHGQ